MITREFAQRAAAVGLEGWQCGQQADPTGAPHSVPDLSAVPGYSPDELRHNSLGRLAPAQARQATRTLLSQLVGLGFGGAFVAFGLANDTGLFTIVALFCVAHIAFKAVVHGKDILSRTVSQVEGDIRTEWQRDSDGPDRFFAHVDELSLEITGEAYRALVPGGPYRLYYLPHAKHAVGGQVLPAWRSLPQVEKQRGGWLSGIRSDM